MHHFGSYQSRYYDNHARSILILHLLHNIEAFKMIDMISYIMELTSIVLIYKQSVSNSLTDIYNLSD